MEATPENIAWMLSRVEVFSHYPNFPKTDRGVEEMCRRVLKFVHNKPIKCPKLAPKSEGNLVNDVDALLNWIADECEFFPLPVVMRRWYQRYFPPADSLEVPDSADYAGGEE